MVCLPGKNAMRISRSTFSAAVLGQGCERICDLSFDASQRPCIAAAGRTANLLRSQRSRMNAVRRQGAHRERAMRAAV